ncbi:MAG TPA: type II toxin-antitoxin system VapC family toxin [Rhodospirillales bacterium]|mgnify:CR=1 FL=1|nr:type II toxin-antitoxin system VapC family toxin [Rhodospirillales bacterium]
MILLDTNVLSALMKDVPETAVVQWLDAQPPDSVWTTTITISEIRFGLALLPPSRRRERLEAALGSATTSVLGGRVLAFDQQAAAAAAAMAAESRLCGRTVDIRDVQIAGIASARGATLATRNTRHFIDFGVALVDPWMT